ncbi:MULTISPECIES: B12-binding domain-containing radical SAM protein [unclassified Bradyrhizobium]|uniref:B12-binding domain-containing radical SAM protein n=1 Tax=unclassified Bradyrhizobium TaxID=2631580 RepID=UPI002915F0E2|nr:MULTISPECIES: radical SAM protein [unclassified Bradyrhizobium]
MFDVLLVNPWAEPVHVSPSYQLIRDEIASASSRLAVQRLQAFFEKHARHIGEYTNVVQYQHRLPFSSGLLSIGAVLEQDGFSVRCVSLALEKKSANAQGDWLTDSLLEHAAQTRLAVGVTAVTPEYPRALAILKIIKARYPHLLTIIGGTHVTYLDGEAASDPAVDIVVRGEGEDTIRELLRLRREGAPMERVAGTTVCIDGEIRRNPDRPLLNLATLPSPAYHLLGEHAKRELYSPPTFTRGCPFACSYCVESLFWDRKLRHKDPKRFVDELEYIVKEMDWPFIHIADSTFGLNRSMTYALCDELERRRLDAVFSVNVRPDLFQYMGDDLVHRLITLNFVEFYFGYESSDQQVLANLKRKQEPSMLHQALLRLKELRVPFVKLYLIIGLPGDTHESMQNTINTIRRLLEEDLIYYATAKYFTPTPGTLHVDERQSEGYDLLTKDWSQFERYNFPPVINHHHLSPIELEQYLSLLQAAQLGVFRRRLGRDENERERLSAWASAHYLKKVYL